MKIVALIPARGRSKRIPRKNIRLLNNIPLIGYPIQTLKKSIINEVWVSTDDDEIAEIAKEFNVKILKRPKELASDLSSTESVIKHFLNNVECNTLVLCEATHPMITTEDINISFIKFKEKNFDSFVLLSSHSLFLWKIKNENLNPLFNLKNRLRTQDIEKLYLESGLWITKRDAFEKSGCRLSGKIGYHIISHPDIDIDNKIDFKIAETLLRN